MNSHEESRPSTSRWKVLLLAVAGMFLTESSLSAAAQSQAPKDVPASSWAKAQDRDKAESFWGEHQGGIATAPQHNVYFAVFDLTTTRREDVISLLKAWTAAAARMTQAETAQPLEVGLQLAAVPAPKQNSGGADDSYETPNPSTMAADTGETIGMSPSRLTIGFGFGAGLFIMDGKDRYGLAAQRPQALVDMPRFNGDQITPEQSGGDLAVQACAEDPQVAFHAVRQLARIAEGVAKIRWVQTGYRPSSGDRHLLGFSAGGSNPEGNPSVDDSEAMARAVWVGSEGPNWMRGGTYMAVRRIRFAVEHWDQMPQAYQESAIGEIKHSSSGSQKAPAGADFQDENDKTHLQIVTPHAASMLRRSYSYNNGVNFTTERWPPWRQGLEYDAGMLFICFQRDPRTGFIATYNMMSKYDAKLNQFWTHEASGLFAYPRGAKNGEYIGQRLFESQ
jgi:deferrochelatase/peroxidase EfeB